MVALFFAPLFLCLPTRNLLFSCEVVEIVGESHFVHLLPEQVFLMWLSIEFGPWDLHIM